jgi:hypothetical protein
VELLRDWIGVGMWPSFLFASGSAMVEGAMQQGGVLHSVGELWGDLCDNDVQAMHGNGETVAACYL